MPDNPPPSYTDFKKRFSVMCPSHGSDYVVALPGHVAPIDPRTLRADNLHRLVCGKESKPEALRECCLQSILQWRREQAVPERECCQASVYLYRYAEGCAEGLRPKTEAMLPQCCQKALRGYRWWKNLEESGSLTLGTSMREGIVQALFLHATPKVPGDLSKAGILREFTKATDDLLTRVTYEFRIAGGLVVFRGQNHRDLASPLERFLAVLWQELPPPPRKPNSAKEFVKRARNLAGGTVSWSRGERCNFRGILEA